MTKSNSASNIDKQYFYLAVLKGQKMNVKSELTSPFDLKDYAADTQEWLRLFELFDDRGGGTYASWNWSAFFFGLLWFAYRKMYLVAFLIFLVFIPLIVAFAAISEVLPYAHLSPFILLGIFSGAYGNALLYKRAKRMAARAHATMPTPEKEIRNLQLNGGTNAWAPAVILSIPLIMIALSVVIPMVETIKEIDELDSFTLVRSHTYTALAELPQFKEIYRENEGDWYKDGYEERTERETAVMLRTVSYRLATYLLDHPEDKRQIVEALGGWEAVQAAMRDAAEGKQHIAFGLQSRATEMAKRLIEDSANPEALAQYWDDVSERTRDGPEMDSKGCYVSTVGGLLGAVRITYHCEAFPNIDQTWLQITPYVPIEGNGGILWRCGDAAAPRNYEPMNNQNGQLVVHNSGGVPARYLPDHCRYQPSSNF